MSETEGTTPAPLSATPTTDLAEDPHGYLKPEQHAKRVALGLRPLHYDNGLPHPDTTPCPAWCRHADRPGRHTVSAFRITEARHESEIIDTVASCYRGRRTEDGATAAVLATRLVKDTHRAPLVRVDLTCFSPSEDDWVEKPKLMLSLDDAQELVTVLQHLIAQADAAEALAANERNAFDIGVDAGAAGLVRPSDALLAERGDLREVWG